MKTIGKSEQLVIVSIRWRYERRFPIGAGLPSFLWRSCGPAHSERVAAAFERFYRGLVEDSRRGVEPHPLMTRNLQADELRCLALIAGLQADRRPLVEAVACWFAPPGVVRRRLLDKAALLARWRELGMRCRWRHTSAPPRSPTSCSARHTNRQSEILECLPRNSFWYSSYQSALCTERITPTIREERGDEHGS